MSIPLSRSQGDHSVSVASGDAPRLDMTGLRHSVGQHAYESWLRHLEFSHLDDGNTAVLYAPTKLIRDFALHNYFAHILQYVRSTHSQVIRIDLLVKPEKRGIGQSTGDGSSSRPLVARPDAADNHDQIREGDHNPLAALPPLSSSKPHPLCTFENFVCGPSNHLSYLLCKQVAEEVLNMAKSTGGAKTSSSSKSEDNAVPFALSGVPRGICLYSQPGMGKSHLLQSIANSLSAAGVNPDRVAYFSAEKFTQCYVGAIRSNRLLEFKAKLAALDILLLDDMQFICDRVGTKKEFIQTADALFRSGRFVVMAMDQHPQHLTLDQHSKSRVVSCMPVGIDWADSKLRLEILRCKLNSLTDATGLNISEDMLLYMAQNAAGSIREMEAMLHRLVTYCGIMKVTASYEVVQQVISDGLLDGDRRNFAAATELKDGAGIRPFISGFKDGGAGGKSTSTPIHPGVHFHPHSILNSAAAATAVSVSDITGRARGIRVAEIRKAAAYIMREKGTALQVIGQALGGRSHSTISYMIKSFAEQIKDDSRTKTLYFNIMEQLNIN